MNNIILTLIITFTKFISLLPRSLFKRNSLIWKMLGSLMKKRKRIVEANINHCFKDKSAEWRNNLIENIWEETYLALYENNFAWNADKRIKKLKWILKILIFYSQLKIIKKGFFYYLGIIFFLSYLPDL